MEIHNYRTFPCLESDLNISGKFIYKYMYMELHIILFHYKRASLRFTRIQFHNLKEDIFYKNFLLYVCTYAFP